jgi:hypothetical protein
MNTYTDQKFREVVWNSTIPVKIDMAIEDVNDVERPPSLYVKILILLLSIMFPE